MLEWLIEVTVGICHWRMAQIADIIKVGTLFSDDRS